MIEVADALYKNIFFNFFEDQNVTTLDRIEILKQNIDINKQNLHKLELLKSSNLGELNIKYEMSKAVAQEKMIEYNYNKEPIKITFSTKDTEELNNFFFKKDYSSSNSGSDSECSSKEKFFQSLYPKKKK